MPHNRDALLALVEKVRAAEGTDRDLDAKIWYVLVERPRPGDKIDRDMLGRWPHYTDSLDAALALAKQVLPRWSLRLDLSEGYQSPCVVMGRSYPTNLRVAVEHRTAPLAVFLAAASALLAQAEAEAGGQHA